ncbi:MbtH family NRPS accessory protein, partial [Acinetobacter baumannii]
MSWGDENTEYDVVINDEEQYSIWPTYRPIPAGWRAVTGQRGPRAA